MSLNKIFLHGYLANVPEMRMTQGGKAVCSFVIAVKRDSSSEVTDFIPCVAWEKRAQFVSQYFTKGQEALVMGSLNRRDWKDKDGNPRTNYDVIVDKVDFCGKKNAAHDSAGVERKPEMEAGIYEDPADDGELPF